MSTYEISKSSLLSLKAEILRKQEEVNKEKLLNKAKAAQGIKKGSPLDLKNKGIKERERNDTVEDEDLLKKSRSALEAKALLYEKLSKGGTNREEDARYLVQFRKKNNDLPPSDSEEEDFDRYPEEEEDESHFSDEYEPAKDPDEEWVEYVDCLGRTRKCMKKDLPYLKKRDSDLKSKVCNNDNEERDQQKEDKSPSSTNPGDFDENSELLSKDMRTELLRRKWEQEEDELRKKTDIHYQDILFDEARVHGVGYYGFSKDEKERARQQEALKKLREETEREQKKAEQLRQMRDKQMAARTRAAKNRKRARLGLPPEEENEEAPNLTETTTNETVEKEKTTEELAVEKEKELMRQKHIRPWDYGKEGVKEHVEYTQEDWIHKQRRERNKEFAPPSLYQDDKNSLYFTSKRDTKGEDNNRKKDNFYIDTSRPPPKIKNPSKRKVNPYKTEEHEDYRKSKKFAVTPIVDEPIDFDDQQDELLKDYLAHKASSDSESEAEPSRRGVEIAPPPTFEYYGPSDVKKKKKPIQKVPIEESISAGLQYLRQQAEKKKNSTNHMQEMFLM